MMITILMVLVLRLIMKTIEEEDITIVMKIVRETKRKIKSPTWKIVTVTFRSLYHGGKKIQTYLTTGNNLCSSSCSTIDVLFVVGDIP
jgi:hypothetical protein